MKLMGRVDFDRREDREESITEGNRQGLAKNPNAHLEKPEGAKHARQKLNENSKPEMANTGSDSRGALCRCGKWRPILSAIRHVYPRCAIPHFFYVTVTVYSALTIVIHPVKRHYHAVYVLFYGVIYPE